MEHSWPVVQRLAARATCSLLSAGLPACQHVLTARRSAPALGATVAQRCGPRLEISAAAAMRPAAAAARALAPPGEGTRRLSGAWASGVEWSEAEWSAKVVEAAQRAADLATSATCRMGVEDARPRQLAKS